MKILKICLIVLMICLFAGNIHTNFLGVADDYWFESFELCSDELVNGKMVAVRDNLFSRDAVLLSGSNVKTMVDMDDARYVPYRSSIGLQGTILSIFSLIFYNVDISPLHQINSFVTSFLFAIILAIVIIWLYKEFGWFTAIFTFLAIMFNPWLVVEGNSTYWALYLDMLPFAAMLILFNQYQKTGEYQSKKINLWMFITVFIKSCAGYEMISVILVMSVLPIFYYGYKNQWNIKTFINRFLKLSMFAILGFFAAIFVHMIVLAFVDKISFFEAVNNFLNGSIQSRTVFGNKSVDNSQAINDSIATPLKVVLETYIITGIYERPLFSLFGKLFFMKHFIYLLGFLFLLSMVDRDISKNINKNRRKIVGLCIMSIVSLIGPVSWLILAKAHCVIHTHITYIIWSLPCLILIFATLGSVIDAVFRDIYEFIFKSKKRA